MTIREKIELWIFAAILFVGLPASIAAGQRIAW